MIISLIAAMSENGVIGKNNKLPWHIPQELKLFKELTLNKPIVMGRKTFESIGKPLPNRQNIVLTHDLHFSASGITVVGSIQDAIKSAGLATELMVIGGQTIYQQFLPQATRLYLSIISKTVEGDAFFPNIDWQDWTLKQTSEYQAFTFKYYEKNN